MSTPTCDTPTPTHTHLTHPHPPTCWHQLGSAPKPSSVQILQSLQKMQHTEKTQRRNEQSSIVYWLLFSKWPPQLFTLLCHFLSRTGTCIHTHTHTHVSSQPQTQNTSSALQHVSLHHWQAHGRPQHHWTYTCPPPPQLDRRGRGGRLSWWEEERLRAWGRTV